MRTRKFLHTAAFLLACLSLFSACGSRPQKLRLQDGAYRTKKELAYCEAPQTYRATSILEGEEQFVATGGVPDTFFLYAIENADPSNWLTDEHYTLFYNEDITLPSLADMKPYAISLCWTVDGTAKERGRLDRDNSAQVDELVRMISEGKSYPKDMLLLAEHDSFELLFHSDEYPEFYYVLQYWKFQAPFVFADGDQTITVETGVVYDRFNGQFYPIGDTLEAYFINA